MTNDKNSPPKDNVSKDGPPKSQGASAQGAASQGAGGDRSKRPTTIDLKASEFRSETGPAAPAGESSTSEEPKAQTSAGASGAVPPRRDSPGTPSGGHSDGPWRMIGIAAAASIVFFAVGFGAAHWLASRSRPATSAAVTAPSPAAPNPELLARIDKLEAAVAAPRQDNAQLLARIAAAEAAVKTAADIAVARDRRNDEVAAMAREARERATSAVTAAEAAQKAGASASPESRADLEALTARIAALEQAARASQADIARRKADAADDARSRLAIAAMALRNAVESGAPFAAELAAAKALSADPRSLAALEPFAASGLPTPQALGSELAGLMPALWKAVRAQDPAQQGSFLERLQANAEKIVRVRPSGEVAGDDPASVNARIETRAGSADIRGALAELAKLPPDARAHAKDWIAKAEGREAAIAAARQLSQNALAALSKSGS